MALQRTGALVNPDVVDHQGDPRAHPRVVKTVAASGAAQVLDLSKFDAFDITLTANCTFTIIGNPVAPANKDMAAAELILRQDGTGSRTGTFPAGMLFPAGSKTLTTTASAIDRVVMRPDPLILNQFLCEITKAYA